MEVRKGTTLLVVGLLLVGGLAVASPVSAHDSEFQPRIHVAFDADGTGYVSIVDSYNLEDDAENETYQSIKNSDDRQQEILDENRKEFEQALSEMSGATDRSPAITKSEIAVYETDHGTDGLVVTRIKVENLAKVSDGGETLTVSEPFASLYSLDDRRLTLVAPSEDYNLVESTPEPDTLSETEHGATWLGESSGEFEKVVFSTGEDSSQPVTEPGSEGTESTAADSGSQSGSGGDSGASPFSVEVLGGAFAVGLLALLGGLYYTRK